MEGFTTSRRNLITSTEQQTPLDDLAQAHLDGLASPAQIAALESAPDGWAASLWRLLDDADASLERARKSVRGPERANVLNDLDDECFRIDEALTALIGAPSEEQLTPAPRQSSPAPREKTGVAQLQLSWNDGQLVAWVAGHDARYEHADVIRELLKATGAGAIEWEERGPLRIPTGQRVPAVTAPVMAALGWLVAQARPTTNDRIGASVHWMGIAAATAISAVAQGRMAPQLRQSRRGGKKGEHGTFSVRWLPGLIDADHLSSLVESC